MAYVIAEPCLDNMDRACVDVCPVDCITTDPAPTGSSTSTRRPASTAARARPPARTRRIYRADELPAAWTGYAWVDAAWYADPDAAREEIDRCSAPA